MEYKVDHDGKQFDESENVGKVFHDGSSSSDGRIDTEEKHNDVNDDYDGQALAPIMFPVDIMIEDVGLKIFEFLNDKDLVSCFRAYHTWQLWLMDQRTRFLFPEVIPFLLQYLPKNSLFECRRVCKSWKIGLDNAYQSHPQHLKIRSQQENSKNNLPELVNRFYTVTAIKTFLQEMKFHTGNPFPGRSILIELRLPGEDETEYPVPDEATFCIEYWNSVIQLLEAFGSQVHFICINFDVFGFINHGGFVNTNAVVILQSCLNRIPNVKNLTIQAYDIINSPQFIQQIPMTQLQQLLCLETIIICGPPITMMDSILESCCVPTKIKRVRIYSIDNRFANSIYLFPNLEVLETIIQSEDFVGFRNLERLPPLKRISIFLYERHRTAEQIFTLLETFMNTLKDVELLSRIGYNENIGFRVNLPNLKRLRIEDYVGPLDPFIQLPSLKYLDVEFDRVRQWEGSIVQLYGFEHKMQYSNIWKLIPTLQTLKMAWENENNRYVHKVYIRLNQGNRCKAFGNYDTSESKSSINRWFYILNEVTTPWKMSLLLLIIAYLCTCHF